MDYPVSDPTVGLVGGKFSDGDPVGGVAASRDPAAWANAVTDELRAIIAAAGLTPSEADLNQVLDALVLLGLRAASSTLPGVVELATDAEVQAGTDTARVVTPAGLASFAQSLAAFGYKKLPGGLILQWGNLLNIAFNQAPGATFSFPIVFPNAVLSFVSTSYFTSSGTTTVANINPSSVSASGVVYQASATIPSGTFSSRWISIGN
jgi:hypothetical protein